MVQERWYNNKMVRITDYLSYIESSSNPLSADVYFIKRENRTFIVDVGNNEKSLLAVREALEKTVIITHFHQDHCGNIAKMPELSDEQLLVGSYTKKSLKRGTVVQIPLHICDGSGLELDVIPIPNSHVKGALGGYCEQRLPDTWGCSLRV